MNPKPLGLRCLLGVVATSLLLGACSISNRVTAPRSAWEQMLSTQAIDRAIAQIEWPPLDGKSVLVALGAPFEGQSAPSDREYLLRRVQVTIADRGAIVALDPDEADLVLTVLVGAIGINIGGRLMGIRGTQGGFFPFTIPELALYKKLRREAFAHAEIALVDRKAGALLHRSGPVEGAAHRTSTTYLLVFRSSETDLVRPKPRKPEE